MRPAIRQEKINETTTLSECHACGEYPHGYWLYDRNMGMNLAMGAPTEKEALIQVLTYYQTRYEELLKEHNDTMQKINSFVTSFGGEDHGED